MYTELAEIPVPVGGQFIGTGPNADTVELIFSVRDHELNLKKTIIKTVGRVDADTPFVSPPTQVDHVAALYSPSGEKRVALREIGNGKDKSRVVELWNRNAKEWTVDVTDRHGGFYADEYSGSLSFSASEDAVVYTAETPLKEDNVSEDPYAKFRYRPDFGEGLSGKQQPTTFVLSWPTSSGETKPCLYRLNAPPGLRLGQCVFSLNAKVDHGEKIVLYATGYELQPDGRFLGVKGCFSRSSGIWKLEATIDNPTKEEIFKEAVCRVMKLTDSNISCRSPHVIRREGSEEVVFLSCVSGGPHVTTSSLNRLTFGGGKTVLKKIAIAEEPGVNSGFAGLYPPYNLPASPFLSQVGDSASVILHTHVGSRTTVVAIDLEGQLRIHAEEEGDRDLYSWSVLATDGHSRILCWRSSTNVPYEIGLLDIKGEGNTEWKVLDRAYIPERIARALSTVQTSIHKVPQREPTETIVITTARKKDAGVLPCILVPHGGPHATTTTAFSPATTALVLEGYTLALPNYTGSLGFGETAVQALVGQCGRRDVDDCIGSLDYLIKLGIAEEGPGRLFVMGGSHGGFLTAHLIGQFPDKFSGAVMRNPVISVGEISTGDIPDWYFLEFGFPYTILSSSIGSTDSEPRDGNPVIIAPLMTPETYSALRKASPIHYVDSVKVPVLLLVGLADRRVAPTQGIDYYHALRGRAKKVDLLTFEGESHPLDGVEAARVCWEAGRDWFKNAKV